MKHTKADDYVKIGPFAGDWKPETPFVNFLTELLLGILGIASLFGIKGGFEYFFDKKKEKRHKAEEEAEAAQDPEYLAKQADKEVKIRVSQALGLFENTELYAEPLVIESEVNEDGVKPIPLLGSLIKLGDRVVIASPPGVGKSGLVTHMGICISEARIPEFLPPETTYKPIPQTVHLFDGELDKDDILERYGMRSYSPRFKRYGNCKFRTFYYLLDKIWKMTKDTYANQTFILDNLYALMPTMTTEETRTFLDGLDIIQQRIAERGYRLSFIIVTHTTKLAREIPSLQDIAGSAHITRFAKNQLVLVKLPEENTYALVTNKKRYSGDKDTYLMSISNEDYLHFEYKSMVSECYVNSILKGKGDKDDATYDNYLEAVRLHEIVGLTWEQISAKMNVSRQTLNNWRNKYEI